VIGLPLFLTGRELNAGEEAYPETSERLKYVFLLSFAFILMVLAFIFDRTAGLLKGSLIILSSPANLLTDYFALAGAGAALLNASVMTFLSIIMVAVNRTKITGPLIAAVFTVTGFSLFGKNLYNSLPIILGVWCYGRLIRSSFRHQLLPALFGTALGPLVSELSFNLGLPPPAGVALGVGAGFLTGLILPVLASAFLRFHQGFNLYNIGFTCGIIGTFFVGVLRSFGVEVDAVSLLSYGNNPAFILILYPMLLTMFFFGLACNRWRLRGIATIFKQSGRLASDFLSVSGFGATLMNMALLGILSTSYVLVVGGEFNGPVLGGILTVIGFGAFGKHLKNVIPVLLGIFLVGLFNKDELMSTPALLAALFGTTLAPVSGYYGPVAGVLAGALHMTMTMNISYLHAGMNLYNNGFSGGFVAAALVPVLNELKKIIKNKKDDKAVTMEDE
jgi:hypothetical protein